VVEVVVLERNHHLEVEVELVVIEHQDLVQVHYKEQHKV
jgi:hypothetical protein